MSIHTDWPSTGPGDPLHRAAQRKVLDADSRPNVCFAAAPGVQELLVENDPARYFVPAYMGVRGWVGARLDGTVDWDGIEQLAREGHTFAAPVPKAARARKKAAPVAKRRRR